MNLIEDNQKVLALLRKFMRGTEVNRAVVYGIATNFFRMMMGPVTMLLIAAHFSQELQGFYYTFGSVLAMQYFVELSLGNVIVQFASHEWSNLSLSVEGQIVGDPNAHSRLVNLGRLVFQWYLIGGVLSTIGLSLAGYIIFSEKSYPGISWMAPWFVLCLLNGIKFFLIPAWSLLEGCNQVNRVYAYRMNLAIFSALATWMAIAGGTGLWSLVLSTAVGILWSGIFLVRRYRRFFRSFFHHPVGPRIGWRDEIWPMQWRLALASIGGYFIAFFFTPVLFHYHGAAVAGQMGMTWALVSTLAAVATLWTATRVPVFGMLIAKKKYQELDRLFFRVTTFSILILCFGALAIWLFTELLNLFKYPLATRLLPPLPTALLLIGQVAMSSTNPLSHYLRAHRREPYLGLSLISGLLIGLMVWWLGSRFGALGAAVAYMAVSTFVTLPYAVIVWHRYRGAWHSDNLEPLSLSTVAVGES